MSRWSSYSTNTYSFAYYEKNCSFMRLKMHHTITSVPAAFVLRTLVSNLPPLFVLLLSRNLFIGAFFGVGDNFSFIATFPPMESRRSATSATM